MNGIRDHKETARDLSEMDMETPKIQGMSVDPLFHSQYLMFLVIWRLPKMVVPPIAGWFIMEYPIKMDDEQGYPQLIYSFSKS
jgi:hypothetical protein